MKILLINTLYPPSTVGGAERSLEVLAKGLVAANCDVSVICLSDTGDTTELREGVTVHRLAHDNRYWPFDGQRRSAVERLRWHGNDSMASPRQGRIEQILAEFDPDIVHTNNLTGFGSGLIPLINKYRLPLIHTLRDFSLICSRASIFKNLQDCETRCLSCRVLTASKVSSATGIDMVVGNSAYMVDRHRHFGLFQNTPSRLIFNAVPGILDERPLAADIASTAELTIGFAGAIKPEKGIEVLLEALRRAGPGPWKLQIAGKGDDEYVSTLRNSYADLPIEWLGFVPIQPFLEGLDLMMIPSIWPEPMPRTLIEAMAMRLPVLVSDGGGSPEVAEMYSGAQLYQRRDIEGLATLLKTAIAEPPARPVADRDVLETFTVERLTANYLQAYADTIAMKHTRKTDHA